MKYALLLCALVCCTASLQAQPSPKFGRLLSRGYAELGETTQNLILVTFTDKPSSAPAAVSEKSLRRRAKVLPPEHLTDDADRPLDRRYVGAVARTVAYVRHELRWFNAVSAVATRSQIDALSRLPFVREIEFVGRWRTRPHDEVEEAHAKEAAPGSPSPAGTASLDYGTSLTQVNQIKVPPVHNLGVAGQGVTVGVFDNGFRLLTHEAFASMNIIAQYDFVDHKTSVIPINTSTGFGAHGVNTLSTIGGYKPGQLIGPAFRADYILARTENDSSETPIEEDNWAAAIQWADSIGIDVTSTSLGYLTYDPPYTSWTWADMDGNTTLITRAADHAVGLGIVVVNSAGNAGAGDSTRNTLGAPADGDSVITAGAVDAAGHRTSFSSIGPTTDLPPRIKPDIMAMGLNVKVASSTITNGYGYAAGTSFSCPLSAGVAALILCARPTLTPIQVRDAMRTTANNAGSPDNFMGWGILNCDSAVKVFGLLPLGRIRGTAFTDVNGNGIRDAGEPAAAGQAIVLGGTSADTVTTDGTGGYAFDSLAVGGYTVAAPAPPGTVATVPSGSYALTLLHAADSSGRDFGFFHLASVGGTIFDDLNGNGVRDSGEAGLPGRGVVMTGPVDTSATTDSAGSYHFAGLPPGTYTIAESAVANWVQSFPPGLAPHQVTVRSGLDSGTVDFGSYAAGGNVYPVENGWNLIALAPQVNENRKDTLYPAATSDAFVYAGSYQVSDTIANGIGYWLKFPWSGNIVVPGLPRHADSVDVVQGWNMIGGLTDPVPVASVGSIPGGLVTSPFFGYAGSYYQADTLVPGSGYFVKAAEPGTLVLGAPAALLPSGRIVIVPTTEQPPPPPEGAGQNLPAAYALGQNYPNPFNPVTVIRYDLPAAGPVTLRVYNILGMLVATLVDGTQEAGRHAVAFDAAALASGIYYYRLTAGGFSELRRMALVR